MYQILAASTRRLPHHKFDLAQRIRHYLLWQTLSRESVFEDQIVFPSKQTFFSCLRSLSLRSARNSPQVHSVPSSEFFFSDSVFFYPFIFWFNFVPVCQECNNSVNRGSRDSAVVRALDSHVCGSGSIPGPGVICGSSLLLFLVLAPRGFLRVLRISSLRKNQHF